MFVVSFVHCKSSLGMRVKRSKNDGLLTKKIEHG